jgi:hypothetical protein
LVLTDFAGSKVDVVNDLGAIPGVTVQEQSGVLSLSTLTLSNYSQVWDLRVATFSTLVNAVLSPSDQSDYAAYLQGGGRLLLAGEFHDNRAQTDRNLSLEAFLDANGGGVSLLGVAGGNQGITTQGVTQDAIDVGFGPRIGVDVEFSNREFLTSVGDGFFVTQDAGTGFGTVAGWDFGDITGAANARMLAYFDSDLRRGINSTVINDPGWTTDLWTFLDGNPGQVIPLPSAAGLGLLGLTFVGVRRRRPW